MPKLYFITNRISKIFTGGEMCNRLLLSGAQKAGFEVEYWEGQKYGPMVKNVLLMNCIYLYKALFMQRNSFLMLDTDFHLRYTAALIWAKCIVKAKVIGVLYNYNYWDKSTIFSKRIHFIVERFVSRQFDYLITISRFSADNFRSLSKRHIPVFIITPYSKESSDISNKAATYSTDCQRLLCVGSIERRKNVLNCVKAMALLKIPFTCDIVGYQHSIKYLSMVSDYIRSNRLENRIFIRGILEREKLLEKYCTSTAFILVSLMEGYGMVYAEAMGFGLPIIGTTRGAVPELVEDGVNGYLCDPDNISEIAEAINKLGDRETWERISTNNLKKSMTLKNRPQFEIDSCETFKKILNHSC